MAPSSAGLRAGGAAGSVIVSDTGAAGFPAMMLIASCGFVSNACFSAPNSIVSIASFSSCGTSCHVNFPFFSNWRVRKSA